ncbi:serine protease gd isoform X2 [Cryptotermes secundus]|uniref:serine protease gd isoform X2 n=1 Tax=Cryptotermes secundus TaxID=105785 RepID=UPI000CD7B44C|nr:serine protease gd isoform X2 [Cryptotermes secundus]
MGVVKQYVGALKLLENENEVWRRINLGDRRPIQFHLYFPLSWPLPLVRSITSNENVICIGNTPNKILTKVSLEHILYPIRGPAFLRQNYNANHLSNAFSSYATPCPSVFQYQLSSSGEWHGIINVPNPYPVVAVDIRVEMYAAGTVPLMTKGFLGLKNNLYEEWNRIRTGLKYYIQYKLEFPTYKSDSSLKPPLPTIKSITVNNEVICRGDKPDFSLLITLSYQHSLFSDKCTSSSLNCPYNIDQSVQQRNNPTLGVYRPVPPTYDPTSAIYMPSPPTYEPTLAVYKPSSPNYETTPATYKPSSPTYEPTPAVYGTSLSTHKTTSQVYAPLPTVYKQVTPKMPVPPPVYISEPTKQETDPGKGTQCGTLIIRSNPLITHGEDTFHGQWPWHAALYLYVNRDIRYMCGGSFVGTRSVITAAHCVTKKEKPIRPGDFIVYLGRYNLRNLNEEGSQNKDVILIHVHPSYNGTSTTGDIALLILSSTVQVTAIVRPVCLWGQDDSNLADIVNKEGLVVGWGLNENDEPTEILMMVSMPVVSQQTCIWSDPNYYSQFTSNKTFCAGFRNGSSVCNGDSGGGMVFPKYQSNGTQIWMLRGIVSHSRLRYGYANICDTRSYIVFTDVAQYLNWIYEILV